MAVPHRAPVISRFSRIDPQPGATIGDQARHGVRRENRLTLAAMSAGPDPSALFERLRRGDRAALARAITLIESTRADHRPRARDLIALALPESGKSIRVGITGVPGVGKSTAIDTLGTNLTAAGHKVAVLAVDPSSTRTGGSILGDKTRMERLSADRGAFIRPSPSAGTLGGVAAKTREAMILCEAAGFDVVLVETVGTGQSETAVSEMVDFFLVLMLAGAGDELQGIKKGVLEIADMIAFNKADGDNTERAKAAAREYKAALGILTPASANWTPPVVTVSAKTNKGFDALWQSVLDHRAALTASGELVEKRSRQQVRWMWTIFDDAIRAVLKSDGRIAARLPDLEAAVAAGDIAPGAAATEILGRLGLSGRD
jgi:LAO/AO transport system kinase